MISFISDQKIKLQEQYNNHYVYGTYFERREEKHTKDGKEQ